VGEGARRRRRQPHSDGQRWWPLAAAAVFANSVAAATTMAADCRTVADVYLILYMVGNHGKSNMDCGWHCSWCGVGVTKSS